ncbi:MAG: response regulator [Anaerolineae bacterium]|nr:MAG: response regulator [Anaerolineae bacterium]MCL4878971.1 response regulator [Anaerolineae bacterium]
MAIIFVLEDDQDLRNLYTRALKFKGYQVESAENAEKAIELLRSGQFIPDAAVLDMSMPGLPGSAVVDYIRTQSPMPDLPIIVISCDDAFKFSLSSSEVKFIPKPINLSDLYSAVAAAV